MELLRPRDCGSRAGATDPTHVRAGHGRTSGRPFIATGSRLQRRCYSASSNVKLLATVFGPQVTV